MNTFRCTIVDGFTYVKLKEKPTLSEVELLENFLNRKKGEFISNDRTNFKIQREFTENYMEMIFKENKMNFYSQIKSRTEKVSLQKFPQETKKESPEELILNFGVHKGKSFAEVDEKYLKWIKETHFDKKMREVAKEVLELRNVVYIKI